MQKPRNDKFVLLDKPSTDDRQEFISRYHSFLTMEWDEPDVFNLRCVFDKGPEFTSVIEDRVSTVETCLIMHILPAVLPCLSHFPTPYLSLLELHPK